MVRDARGAGVTESWSSGRYPRSQSPANGGSPLLVNQVRRFGESLVERHVLSRDSLEHAMEEAERTDQPLPAVLLRLGLVGSKDLTAALAEQLGIPFVDCLETPIHQDAPTLLTAEMARKWVALPVDFEDRKLIVAFAEPADDEAVAAGGTPAPAESIAPVAAQDAL